MKLGRNQLSILRCLAQDGPYPGSAWIWENHSTTVRICESLVKRGLVSSERREVRLGLGRPNPPVRILTTYSITEAGRELVPVRGQH
jgi:DNA-binding MarR family transcriptional regulator